MGVELDFEDLERAKEFYLDALGLCLADEHRARHAKFDADAAFLCLETKGSKSYPSRDRGVLFFEVPDLQAPVSAIGPNRFVPSKPLWAVLQVRKGTTFCSFKPV